MKLIKAMGGGAGQGWDVGESARAIRGKGMVCFAVLTLFPHFP